MTAFSNVIMLKKEITSLQCMEIFT